jgi:hypothetical protein
MPFSAFLDRSNLGNAKVAGLAEDLQLTGTQFNLAATVLIVPITTDMKTDSITGLLLSVLPSGDPSQHCLENTAPISMDCITSRRLGYSKCFWVFIWIPLAKYGSLSRLPHVLAQYKAMKACSLRGRFLGSPKRASFLYVYR